MSNQYVIFQSFTDSSLAASIAERLKEQDISFEIEDTSSPVDPLIIGSDMNADIRIKLRQEDFPKGRAVIESYYAPLLNTVEPDYYLFDFTGEELEQIIENPYAWGQFDYLLAQKLLRERGRDIVPEELEDLKVRQLREMARPEKVSRSWVWLGYFIAVCFSPLGIFYGGTLTSFKKTLPDGQRIYAYDAAVRTHGQRILIISSALTVFWLMAKVLLVK